MIKGIFSLFGYILKLIAKGLIYSFKGIVWFAKNFDSVVRDVKLNNRKEIKVAKKQEIF